MVMKETIFAVPCTDLWGACCCYWSVSHNNFHHAPYHHHLHHSHHGPLCIWRCHHHHHGLLCHSHKYQMGSHTIGWGWEGGTQPGDQTTMITMIMIIMLINHDYLKQFQFYHVIHVMIIPGCGISSFSDGTIFEYLKRGRQQIKNYKKTWFLKLKEEIGWHSLLLYANLKCQW